MLLEMKKITKRFGELKANDGIDLSLEKGEVLAVVGENGAGKSTLLKILYGMQPADEGEIWLNGKKMIFHSPHDAIQNGIGMVQQHFMLVKHFTVAENVVYGKEPKKGLFFDRGRAIEVTKELSEKYNLQIDPQAKIEDCPVGLQQRVEILKVLYQQAEIIIFDEPSAVLTPPEIEELLKTIRELAAMGKSIILVTHKLNEVKAVADRVMIMRSGKKITEIKNEDATIEEMSYQMVGRKLVQRKVEKRKTQGAALEVKNLVFGKGKKKAIDGIDIHVDFGEIVGIAGVSGNGQSELIRCLTGILPVDGGSIMLMGAEIKGRSVKEIRNLGCACIPEDRYLWGSAGQASLEEVAVMYHHRKSEFSKFGFLKEKHNRQFTTDLLEQYNVRYASISQKMKELSGGNAQKLIIAREMSNHTPFLIAAEPTRGLDIGAIEYIHGKLLSSRENSVAVLLVSSDLSEIMTLSDRIYVMYDGKIVGELTREEATEEKLGILMMGGTLSA